jgi:hypothetical protein
MAAVPLITTAEHKLDLLPLFFLSLFGRFLFPFLSQAVHGALHIYSLVVFRLRALGILLVC